MTGESYKKLCNQLKRHEGFRNKPYRCTAGKLTIGYGRNLDDKGISEAEADIMLSNDVSQATEDARVVIDVYPQLNNARQSVLINMAFNIGRGDKNHGLRSFRKMIAAINKFDFKTASEEMLDSRYARDVGQRAVELAKQLETGEWQ